MGMDKSFLAAQKSQTDALKTAWKRAIQKMAEVSGDLVENKIEEKITKKAASKTSHEDPSKSMAPTQIDENSVQPIKIPKWR